jgi:hypothetical protein
MKRASVLLISLLATISLQATEPPRGGGQLPDAYRQRLREQPHAFSFRHALLPYVQSVLHAREAALGRITQNFSEMIALGQTSSNSSRRPSARFSFLISQKQTSGQSGSPGPTSGLPVTQEFLRSIHRSRLLGTNPANCLEPRFRLADTSEVWAFVPR